MTAPAAFADLEVSSEFAPDGPKANLLRLVLEAGVPARILEYQRDGRSVQWLQERAQWAGEMVTSHGDALLYRTKARTIGEHHYPSTAEVCNALVEGVACCALVAEGGITIFGLRFDAELGGAA